MKIIFLTTLFTFCSASININTDIQGIGVESKSVDDVPNSCAIDVEIDTFSQIGKKYYFVEADKMMNWYGAAHHCRSKNSTLASIESKEEMNAIKEYLNSKEYREFDPQLNVFYTQFWISGNDLETEGKYHWLGTGKPMEYMNWTPRQHPIKEPDENCVLIWSEGEEFYMDDVSCDTKLFFICEATTPQTIALTVW